MFLYVFCGLDGITLLLFMMVFRFSFDLKELVKLITVGTTCALHLFKLPYSYYNHQEMLMFFLARKPIYDLVTLAHPCKSART